MKLEQLLNKISSAAPSDVVLEIQMGAQDLTVPSSGAWLYLGRFPGRQVDAPHASDVFLAAAPVAKSSASVARLCWSTHTADEMSLCLLTRTVHKLPIIGTAKFLAAGGTAASFKGL